jgi:hypothetical protein
MPDQTEDHLRRTPFRDGKGTGIFIVPDRTRPNGIRKDLVKDVTYDQCVQRGALAREFKWVPDSVKSFDDIQRTTCGQPCRNQRCVEPGCVCVNGVCV